MAVARQGAAAPRDAPRRRKRGADPSGSSKEGHMVNRMLLGAICAAMAMTAGLAGAATLRWANDGDVNSMDPYARSETFLLTFNGNMYEPLVTRDRDLKLEPALATEWTQATPN